MFTVEYADDGSIRRSSEEQAYIFFADFLDEGEGKTEPILLLALTLILLYIEASGSLCTLEDVCVFFSGAMSIPPAGWPKKPTLQFSHQSQFPTSSTCSLILRLSAMHTSYDSFKEAMVLGIKGNDGFGGP